MFEQRRREWIRWVRPRASAGCLLVLAWMAVLAGFVPRERSFLLGVGVGAAVALYLAIVELAIPVRIENWRVGAEAERRTGRRLLRLQLRGWVVHHSIVAERSDRDHVVFGPTGVFLIDTKERRGRCVVESGTLVTRYRFSGDDAPKAEDLSERCKSRAKELGALIGQIAGYRPWVQPVVVIWGDFEQQAVRSEGVAFVHGNQLRNWLESNGPRDRSIDHAGRIRSALTTIARDGIAISRASHSH